MKDFCTQSPVGFVTSVQNTADKTAPAVRLRQAAPPCRPTLGHTNCQVDIWDMHLSLNDRTCRFEQMEPRQLLAADGIPSASQPGLSIESPAIETAVVQVSLGSVGGRVHLALDDNCQNSADNAGLSGVTIHLLSETGFVLDVTQTDAAGGYQFTNLSPGIYAVHEIQPAGMADLGAHLGSGGGIAFDNNLLGEIQVLSGSDLVDYNFCEHPAEDPSPAGGEQLPLLARHSDEDTPSENVFSAGAAWQLLYDSSPASSRQSGLLFESPTIATATDYQTDLSATFKSSTPFYGTFTHAEAQPFAGEWNGNGFDAIDLFHEGLWPIDIEFDNWFTANNRLVLFADTSDAPDEGNWNDDSIDDIENLVALRKDSWILDREDSRELDAADYDQVFEADGTDEKTVDLGIEATAEEVQKLSSLSPKA